MKEKTEHPYRFLTRLLVKLAAFAAVFFLVNAFVLTPHRMTGNSMFPMVKDGDLVLFYRLGGYHIGDVVLYKDADGKQRVGRIAAAAGDTVDFPAGGGYLVNGGMPAEEITYETYAADAADVAYPLEIAEGMYFVLNDFRSDTGDSRQSGPVARARLMGKAVFILRRRSF